MVSRSNWAKNSLLFLYEYSYDGNRIDLTIENETSGQSYTREQKGWKYFTIWNQDGSTVLTKNGNPKRLHFDKLIKLGTSERIRVRVKYGTLEFEGFISDYWKNKGIQHWKLLDAPNYLNDEQYALWSHLENLEITIDDKTKGLLETYGHKPIWHKWDHLQTHLTENIYLDLKQVSYGLFEGKKYFGYYGRNEESIFEILDRSYKPIEKIPESYYKSLKDAVRGKPNLDEFWMKYLTERWNYPEFKGLNSVYSFFKGWALLSKKWVKNYRNRVKKWVNPLFETIKTTIWKIWLINISNHCLVFDSINKIFVGFRIKVLQFIEREIKPIFKLFNKRIHECRQNQYDKFIMIQKLFAPIRNKFAKSMSYALRNLFNPLQNIRRTLQNRERHIFNSLDLHCVSNNCNTPIQFSNLFNTKPDIRNMIFQYYYNKQFNDSTPPLKFVCCYCIHDLTRQLTKRKLMLASLFKLFNNVKKWLLGLEEIYFSQKVEATT